jgi:hypothetical protein
MKVLSNFPPHTRPAGETVATLASLLVKVMSTVTTAPVKSLAMDVNGRTWPSFSDRGAGVKARVEAVGVTGWVPPQPVINARNSAEMIAPKK